METKGNPGKTTAIIAYLALIGWIIAFILNNKDKNALASYHIRQSLGIILMYVAVSILIRLTGIEILWLLYLGVLILVIIGIMNASNEEEKPLPIFGEYFQDWFKGLG